MKVFLGGPCNESTWRDELIHLLADEVDYFNPVVPDWTPECMAKERIERVVCDVCLYVITPRMTGLYATAEAVDDSNKRPSKTVFCFLTKEGDCSFTHSQQKSLEQVRDLIQRNGGWVCNSLTEIADYLNRRADYECALGILEG